jgi:hypothetical protein
MVPGPLWDRSNATDSGGYFVATVLGPGIAGALLTRSISLTLLVGASCAIFAGLWPAVLPASSYEPMAQVATAT